MNYIVVFSTTALLALTACQKSTSQKEMSFNAVVEEFAYYAIAEQVASECPNYSLTINSDEFKLSRANELLISGYSREEISSRFQKYNGSDAMYQSYGEKVAEIGADGRNGPINHCKVGDRIWEQQTQSAKYLTR